MTWIVTGSGWNRATKKAKCHSQPFVEKSRRSRLFCSEWLVQKIQRSASFPPTARIESLFFSLFTVYLSYNTAWLHLMFLHTLKTCLLLIGRYKHIYNHFRDFFLAVTSVCYLTVAILFSILTALVSCATNSNSFINCLKIRPICCKSEIKRMWLFRNIL